MSFLKADERESGPRTASDMMLRLVLKLDAVVTAGNGVAYLALTGLINEYLGYPRALQYATGVFLVVYGAAVMLTATRPTVNRGTTRLYIVVNVLWAVASIAALATGLLSATALGAVWAVLQAAVVAGFGALQAMGLRKVDQPR